ncbi:MAG TPA: hypothetical protein DCX06_00490 [Opitutae bacterium]|nr:hypothetical protein [Opitutae bacterium]
MFKKTTDWTLNVGQGLSPSTPAWRSLGRGIKPLLQLALATLALATPLSANSALEDNSPFLPPDHNKKPVVAPKPVQSSGPISREIEFRGVVQMNNAYQVSVFDKTNLKGYWIPVGQEKEGIKVSAFDPKSMGVTINKNGRSEKLSMMESTDSPLPVAISAPPPNPNASANNAAQPQLPAGLQNATRTNNTNTNKRIIPRRRVILPKK